MDLPETRGTEMVLLRVTQEMDLHETQGMDLLETHENETHPEWTLVIEISAHVIFLDPKDVPKDPETGRTIDVDTVARTTEEGHTSHMTRHVNGSTSDHSLTCTPTRITIENEKRRMHIDDEGTLSDELSVLRQMKDLQDLLESLCRGTHPQENPCLDHCLEMALDTPGLFPGNGHLLERCRRKGSPRKYQRKGSPRICHPQLLLDLRRPHLRPQDLLFLQTDLHRLPLHFLPNHLTHTALPDHQLHEETEETGETEETEETEEGIEEGATFSTENGVIRASLSPIDVFLIVH